MVATICFAWAYKFRFDWIPSKDLICTTKTKNLIFIIISYVYHSMLDTFQATGASSSLALIRILVCNLSWPSYAFVLVAV